MPFLLFRRVTKRRLGAAALQDAAHALTPALNPVPNTPNKSQSE